MGMRWFEAVVVCDNGFGGVERRAILASSQSDAYAVASNACADCVVRGVEPASYCGVVYGGGRVRGRFRLAEVSVGGKARKFLVEARTFGEAVERMADYMKARSIGYDTIAAWPIRSRVTEVIA